MTEKQYNAVCRDLGFKPETNFIVVEPDGKISFSCGKPDEIRALYKAVRDKGYAPAQSLINAIR